MSNNETIMLALQKICGAAHVFIEFNGGGDSGQIDSIEVTGLLDKKALEELSVPPELETMVMPIRRLTIYAST